ncbi:cysteine dioxygenase family protein [Mycobacterium sp. M1]|uniref:Cysteine dioxygenase family protein n=1 Tax=Mycolicibacter acidiphilus TaxID=2835306 RepID=A0ABS5RNQ7_9MYCO|nr:cysteine dioxygenase family protein [Mycolicibacter acidiphilus]MBS9535662.1 cysteine dioxygenase family protein [Mycolicibacter acidiphilus]
MTVLAAPTALRVPDLLRATDLAADAVLNGEYDHLLPADGLPTDERWFTRIHGDDTLDIWLISWVPGHATELHDHGESQGALTVISGAVDEYRWDDDQLKSRRLGAGDQAGFPLGWVHDVTWAPSGTPESGPTLSVHAYSPPLAEMSYYAVAGDTLHRQRTELTDQPEKP